MIRAGFEPTIPANERPQTHALDRAATGIGISYPVSRCKWYRVKPNFCGRSLAGIGIVGSNPPPPEAWMFVVSIVCCQVEVSVTGRSLVQKSPTECDRESSIMRRPWSTGGFCAIV